MSGAFGYLNHPGTAANSTAGCNLESMLAAMREALDHERVFRRMAYCAICQARIFDGDRFADGVVLVEVAAPTLLFELPIIVAAGKPKEPFRAMICKHCYGTPAAAATAADGEGRSTPAAAGVGRREADPTARAGGDGHLPRVLVGIPPGGLDAQL
jgi:hypothetical protein